MEDWSKTTYNENIDTISKQIIWNNSNIQCNKQIFYFKEWHNKGIQFVKPIYDFENKRFYAFEKLQKLNDINTHNLLKFYSLVKSIPVQWKQFLHSVIYHITGV